MHDIILYYEKLNEYSPVQIDDIIDYSMNVDAERGGGFYEIKL